MTGTNAMDFHGIADASPQNEQTWTKQVEFLLDFGPVFDQLSLTFQKIGAHLRGIQQLIQSFLAGVQPLQVDPTVTSLFGAAQHSL
jgi:hypothetical protein